MEEIEEKPARIIKTGKRKLRVSSLSSDENDETKGKAKTTGNQKTKIN